MAYKISASTVQKSKFPFQLYILDLLALLSTG
jgi:hypothetical protein